MTGQREFEVSQYLTVRDGEQPAECVFDRKRVYPIINPDGQESFGLPKLSV